MRGSFFQAIFFSTLFLIIAWGSFQLSLIENLGKKDSSLSITTTNNSGGALQTNNNFTSPSNQLIPPNTEQKQHFSTQIQPQTKDKTPIALLSTATSALRYCPPPGNWNAIFIQPSDTIASLSRKYQISPQQLLVANCLKDMDISPGKIIYVPPLPTAQLFTSTPTQCVPPVGWVYYTIQTGDTLTSLSISTHSTVEQIMRANCLTDRLFLRTGQQIYLPYLPFTPLSSTKVIPWWTITPSNSTIYPTSTSSSTNIHTSTPIITETPAAAATTSIPTDVSEPIYTISPELTNATTPSVQQNAYPTKNSRH